MRRMKKKNGIKGQKEKPPTLNWAIDVLIGDEEQNGKQNKEENKNWEHLTQLP